MLEERGGNLHGHCKDLKGFIKQIQEPSCCPCELIFINEISSSLSRHSPPPSRYRPAGHLIRTRAAYRQHAGVSDDKACARHNTSRA
jgi:hypothetical protein